MTDFYSPNGPFPKITKSMGVVPSVQSLARFRHVDTFLMTEFGDTTGSGFMRIACATITWSRSRKKRNRSARDFSSGDRLSGAHCTKSGATSRRALHTSVLFCGRERLFGGETQIEQSSMTEDYDPVGRIGSCVHESILFELRIGSP